MQVKLGPCCQYHLEQRQDDSSYSDSSIRDSDSAIDSSAEDSQDSWMDDDYGDWGDEDGDATEDDGWCECPVAWRMQHLTNLARSCKIVCWSINCLLPVQINVSQATDQ
jgi:hypothetical protein